ncbi:MAG: hypothetical protein ABIN57_03540 [Chitinophagaceae bacterium]
MKKISVTLSFLICCYTLLAQVNPANKKVDKRKEKQERINSIIRQEEEGVISYNKQNSLGIQLRTNGYGIFYELGKMKTPRFSNMYTIELTEIKHPKEEKSGGENIFANTYVFGKVNNFYQAKFGFGQQYIIGQKGNKNGIAVIGIYQGGLSLGLLKPYYLQVLDSVGRTNYLKFSPKDSSRFLDKSSIIAGAPFTKGFNEMTLNPGLFGKVALRFDFGRSNESVQAIEIGMSVDAYSKKVKQMLYNKEKQLFFQGHVAFVFGRRK